MNDLILALNAPGIRDLLVGGQVSAGTMQLEFNAKAQRRKAAKS